MKDSGVILVVDMLKGFLKDGVSLYCGKDACKIISCVVRLLSENRDKPVIYICDSHTPDDKEFKMFPAHCVAGTEEAEIIDELKPFPGTIVLKTTLSAFYKTELEDHLKTIKPETVTVVGVCTDICILYTVADLRVRYYKVIVPISCVASFNKQGHDWAIHYMEKVLGATIVME